MRIPSTTSDNMAIALDLHTALCIQYISIPLPWLLWCQSRMRMKEIQTFFVDDFKYSIQFSNHMIYIGWVEEGDCFFFRFYWIELEKYRTLNRFSVNIAQIFRKLKKKLLANSTYVNSIYSSHNFIQTFNFKFVFFSLATYAPDENESCPRMT